MISVKTLKKFNFNHYAYVEYCSPSRFGEGQTSRGFRISNYPEGQVQGQGHGRGHGRGHGHGPWHYDKVSWKFCEDKTSRGFRISYSLKSQGQGQGRGHDQGQGQGHGLGRVHGHCSWH